MDVEKAVDKHARYRQAHRDKTRAATAAWYALHRDDVLKKRRDRYHANRETLKEQRRDYYVANREAILENTPSPPEVRFWTLTKATVGAHQPR